MAVERLAASVLSAPDQPTLLVKERARLACGCCCFFGVRLDNQEIASAACACSDAHATLIAHFVLLLKESLVEPQARPLADVADELLAQAARYQVAA